MASADSLTWKPGSSGLLGRCAVAWSQLLFPGAEASSDERWPVRLCELLLVLAAGLLCFTSLDCALQEPEETLYAEIPRQMLAEGRWLVPVRHGQDYYDKPPLLYWLVMAVYALGDVSDTTARLVPATASFLCVLVTYTWGKHTAGARAGFAGAVMLCLSPRYAQMARMLTTNGLLTLEVVAALAAAHLALRAGKLERRWWLVSALICGLGVLTKGPVALVLVALPVFLYSVLDTRSARPTARLWFAYGAVVAGVALPWFIAVAVRDPAFVEYFLWTHHVRRVLAPIDHPQPPGYYLPLLTQGMLPWTLLLPWFVYYLLRRPEGQTRPAALGVFLLTGGWAVLFFSLSGCKRPCYILPAMPPLALALGCFVDGVLLRQRHLLRAWAGLVALAFVVLFGAALWWLPGYAQRFSLRPHLLPLVGKVDKSVDVVCYPHGWDAVYFYLQRGDVHVYKRGSEKELISRLEQSGNSLVVVKTDCLRGFLHAMPTDLCFQRCSGDAVVTVGWLSNARASAESNNSLAKAGSR